MPTLSMAELAVDPDFGQAFTITRRSGIFALGQFSITSTAQIPVFGIIQPASKQDMEKLEEGDRTEGMMSFIAQAQFFLTRTDGIGGTTNALSDLITWRGASYTLVSVDAWGDFGF